MDLSVNYNGLKIKNPIVVGSSGLTNTVAGIKELENNGAGAVVLKSLFEEQLNIDANKTNIENNYDYPEAFDYINAHTKVNLFDNYIKLIKDAKKSVKIPIIASINCYTDGKWIKYAKEMEEAGADALEINISFLPSDIEKSSADNEKLIFDIIENINKTVSIPISLKMSYYSSGLANLIRKISWTQNVNSIVLFNRYYSPDIDINKLSLTSSNTFSSEEEITKPLRWIALLYGRTECDLIASTGVHNGEGLIKQLLVGANSVQVVSAIYKHGSSYLTKMLDDLKKWMKEKDYNSIDDFRGKLSYENLKNNPVFERVQFMKYFGGIE